MINKIPTKHEINAVFAYFSKREWVAFIICCAILLFSTLAILESINRYFMVSIPMHGGSLSQGMVGTPRFINPVLANSVVDQDLVSLVYSGLMRKNPEGKLIPDLAEKVEESENGLVYTFTLKNNIYFQDGSPVTADDILFTINKVKDGVIKSPHKVNWDGVAVEKIDEKTIRFNLKQTYASFLENTTLGIMPASIWENSPIELNDANTNPIGSGPYQITKISQQSSGIIDSYELTEFKKFALGEPYIKNITLHFYSNENNLITALLNNEVDQISSITPKNAELLKEKGFQIESSILPRVFGLFFNQNQNQIFIDKAVVKAIDQAINKDRIISEVLFGYGVTINDPIPPSMTVYQKLTQKNVKSREEIITNIQSDLAKDGWVKGTDGFLQKTTTEKKKKVTTNLAFSISTGNAPELTQTALLIRDDLAAVGIKVDVKTFEVGNLNQSVIRPRKYDALLFGQIINHESDLFAFWHSSQRKDPGLNVAMYTNAKVDKILEDAFFIVDADARIKKYIQFEDEVRKDMPAVFIYSPYSIYIVSPKVKQFVVNSTTTPENQFSDIYSWYIDTENVWRIFAK